MAGHDRLVTIARQNNRMAGHDMQAAGHERQGTDHGRQVKIQGSQAASNCRQEEGVGIG